MLSPTQAKASDLAALENSLYRVQDDSVSSMNEAFARLCSTDDAKEGVRAFFEKRNPVREER